MDFFRSVPSIHHIFICDGQWYIVIADKTEATVAGEKRNNHSKGQATERNLPIEFSWSKNSLSIKETNPLRLDSKIHAVIGSEIKGSGYHWDCTNIS